jgi:RNA polymerase sigma factor (sigma-70 family)
MMNSNQSPNNHFSTAALPSVQSQTQSQAQPKAHPEGATLSQQLTPAIVIKTTVNSGGAYTAHRADEGKAPQPKTYDVRDYINLVERVARAEYRRIPQHMVDYEELVSIGVLAIQLIVQNKKPEDLAKLNISYMATAIRWAIRNELRTRFKWYSQKQKADDYGDDVPSGDAEGASEGARANQSEETVRQAVYQTVLSIDSMNTSDDGGSSYDTIADKSATPEEELEATELGRAIKAAIQTLPSKDRYIVECRFYKNMQVKDIAIEVGLSSSRITRIVQGSLAIVRDYLKTQQYIQP